MRPGETETRAFLFAISDYSRFAILAALLKRSMCVNEIVRETGIGQSNASHHLLCLANCGFVTVERKGKERVYRLNREARPIIRGMLTHIKGYKRGILSCNIANRDYVSKIISKKGE